MCYTPAYFQAEKTTQNGIFLTGQCHHYKAQFLNVVFKIFHDLVKLIRLLFLYKMAPGWYVIMVENLTMFSPVFLIPS